MSVAVSSSVKSVSRTRQRRAVVVRAYDSAEEEEEEGGLRRRTEHSSLYRKCCVEPLSLPGFFAAVCERGREREREGREREGSDGVLAYSCLCSSASAGRLEMFLLVSVAPRSAVQVSQWQSEPFGGSGDQ